MKIEKRDGRLKDFDISRVHSAIEAAFKEVYPGVGAGSVGLNHITYMINTKVDKLKKECIHVEELQDIIIESIQWYDKDVAKAYSNYRFERSLNRDRKSILIKNIEGLLDCSNEELIKENANKQSRIAATQRDLIAGEVSKHMADMVIPRHLLEAHNLGLMKIHDKDYWMQPITNCELVDLDGMLQNGTVINKKKIRKPKSLRTAMTIATQIAAQVASNTYGGQTISIAHLAPFVRISEKKLRKKYKKYFDDDFIIDRLVNDSLREEIKDSVQTFNYQISTISCVNGQAPFISVELYINSKPGYEKETIMLIEEFLIQRIAGMENEHGVVTAQTFPKLLYFMDENNAYEGSEYFWLTELAARSLAYMMSPDIISVKKMKEVIGHAFPSMGCRAFLSPFKDKDGNYKFWGRGNLGVQTINLPYIALLSKENNTTFEEELDKVLELARQLCEIRYEKLRGVKAEVAPIMWMHGAISRLEAHEPILKAIDENGFTVTIGYSGLHETVKILGGGSLTSEFGFAMGEGIMKYLEDKLNEFKKEQPHLRFALYGTPQESTTGWFHDKIKARFGVVEGVSDKGWITNSYHVDIQEPIDAFTKLKLEGQLQAYSKGGAISYVEAHNMQKNIPAVIKIMQTIYEEVMYGEMNFELDTCGVCGFKGVMNNNPENLKWYCPQCGCTDQSKLSVIRRTCGYLGETEWADGRTLDILNRVKHI